MIRIMMYFLVSLIYFTHQSYIFADKGNKIMNNEKQEIEIPFTEDLMKEHGLLNRILLLYEEIIKRIDTNTDFSLNTLKSIVNIFESFIGNYHEKLEEEYVFPLFEKHKKELRLIKTLKNQHTKGREITKQLQKTISPQTSLDNKTKKTIKTLLQKYIRMYRPHEVREDTILFPQVRSLINEEEFKELSEKFEEIEHQLFGDKGFESIIKKIEDIEKELGVYQLEQFTPNI